MTPKETYLLIEVYGEKEEILQKRLIWLAWHTAGFVRTKTLPKFEALIKPPKAKRLSENEKAKRQAEFENIKNRFNGDMVK